MSGALETFSLSNNIPGRYFYILKLYPCKEFHIKFIFIFLQNAYNVSLQHYNFYVHVAVRYSYSYRSFQESKF